MRRRRSSYSSRNKGSSKSIMVIVLGLMLGAGAYLMTAKEFERVDPVIKSANHLYWNRKDPLLIAISDDTALKSYQVQVSDGVNSITTTSEVILEANQKERTVRVEYPKKAVNGVMLDPKSTKFKVTVSVQDRSNWGFFQGNKVTKELMVDVDYKRPQINILANSYSVTQGGAGLIVFQVRDDAMKHFYLEAGGRKFKASPYREAGTFAALVAWPFNQDDFSARVVAEDMAGNRRVVNVPFFIKPKNYKVSWIRAKDKFIDGKISDLADSEPEYALIKDRVAKLKAINEDMRKSNEDIIHDLSMKISDNIIDSWTVKPFYPLKNGAKVASYGDHRHYYYEEKSNEISQSYHVGLDMASTKMAKVVSSNDGIVVYSDYNGIYGNMPMIDHGMGLYTLYGHCSNIMVQEGDEIAAGTAIAQTGVSGLALGDHLHFGILVQGIEVRPEEWMDKKWINDNINKIFKEADKILNGSD
ncbi:MAG: M23 family metallopeptidase [Sulfurovaceae bacterium]|nr:M23 family metallopeptidase [Sulfurovaceae bacterium]